MNYGTRRSSHVEIPRWQSRARDRGSNHRYPGPKSCVMDESPVPKISTMGYNASFFVLFACIVQVSLAPKAASEGSETNEETISKQADMLVEQVPVPFNIKV